MTPSDQTAESAVHDLLMAFADPSDDGSCPICRLVVRSAERDIRSFFAEFVNDPKARVLFRSARGFCPEHAALLPALGDALATAILYADLTSAIRERWAADPPRRKPSFLAKSRPLPTRDCPACESARSAASRYSSALADAMERDEIRGAMERGSGLCVAHSEQVMRYAKPAAAAFLRKLEMDRLASLEAELREIIRKNDYRFRGEEWGAERDAWLRALLKITRPK